MSLQLVGMFGVKCLELPNEVIDGLKPFLFYFALVLAVVVIMLGLSYFLGQRKTAHHKNLPFESGIVSVGSAQFRISVHFYLPAILFIIFDLEVVFLFAWAVSVREAGWLGFIEISVFIFILIAASVLSMAHRRAGLAHTYAEARIENSLRAWWSDQ